MAEPLFSITCATCQARLAVRDEAAIGQILTCPKCESMVEVTPPPGWKPPPKPSSQPRAEPKSDPQAEPEEAPNRGEAGKAAAPGGAGAAPGASKTRRPPKQAGKKRSDRGGSRGKQTRGAQPPANKPTEPRPGIPSDKPVAPPDRGATRRTAQAASGAAASAGVVPPPADAPVPPPVEATEPSAAPPEAPAQIGEPGPPPPGAEEAAATRAEEGAALATPRAALAPAELLWRKWLLLAAAPVVGVVVGVFVWLALSSRGPEPSPPVDPPNAPQEAEPSTEEPAPPEPEPTALRLDPRWLPAETRWLVSLRSSDLAGEKAFRSAVPLGGPAWDMVRRLTDAFGVRLETIRRLSWASTDLEAWPDPGLIVVELVAGHDAGVFRREGKPADVLVDGKVGRRLTDGDWPHPFVVIDRSTILTGRPALLDAIADREGAALKSVPIDRLFQAIGAEADAFVLVDLASARAAGWQLPTSVMDVWPAGREPWRVVWEVPHGLGFSVPSGRTGVTEVALVCEGPTAAQNVEAALDELIPAAQAAIRQRSESLAEPGRGAIPEAAAASYRELLTGVSAALEASRWEVVDQTVWVRVDWGAGLSDAVVAGVESRPAIRAAWLDAAFQADEANVEGILAGLGKYHRAKGSFPAGAGGAALLSPESRLSWIASALPYLGHEDWFEELHFGYPWNGGQNRAVTRRRLDRMINPALGPSTTEAGFPVTHYVGVAGVGPDAGFLEPGHFRAGLFGFNRTTRLDEIPDGASNTLAILGVSEHLGGWGSGGNATVRGLTKPPYVNGPDGFGSGQPGGMLVGMADGSVRFVSKEIDPIVLEQLATIGGGERATVAALGPPRFAQEPRKPKPAAQVAAAKEPPSKPAPSADDSAAAGPAEPVEPVRFDVEARLGARVVQIGFPDVPLGDAVRLVSQLSMLPITFDLEAMAELGVSVGDPVRIDLSGATLAEVLKAVLAEHGLVYVVDRGQVLVTSPGRKRGSTKPRDYTVSDLTGRGVEATAKLADLVRDVVAPESWEPSGGQGTVEAAPGVLKVVQTDAVHFQVLTLCERLRSARGLPLRSRYDPAMFSLATRFGRARAKLSQPITANFPIPTPLERILSEFERASSMELFVDWIALGAQGMSPTTESTVRADRRPLGEALDALLRALGLGYRAVDADAVEITTRAALLARLEREFYAVGDLLSGESGADALTAKIKAEVAGATWTDGGGSGVIRFDEPSKCLLVLQAQPVQREVEALLQRWRGERNEPGESAK